MIGLIAALTLAAVKPAPVSYKLLGSNTTYSTIARCERARRVLSKKEEDRERRAYKKRSVARGTRWVIKPVCLPA
jgi:hypothetical protein